MQVIGVVVATSEAAARAGARAVEVGYEDLPAVMSIEEAIEAGAFYEDYKGKVGDRGSGRQRYNRRFANIRDRQLGLEGAPAAKPMGKGP